jgi:hypothetical protein
MKAKTPALNKKKNTDSKATPIAADMQPIPMRRTPTASQAPSEPATVRDQAAFSDQVRDDILRHQLTYNGARSSADRHRERLTVTEEGIPDNEDEAKSLDELL